MRGMPMGGRGGGRGGRGMGGPMPGAKLDAGWLAEPGCGRWQGRFGCPRPYQLPKASWLCAHAVFAA